MRPNTPEQIAAAQKLADRYPDKTLGSDGTGRTFTDDDCPPAENIKEHAARHPANSKPTSVAATVVEHTKPEWDNRQLSGGIAGGIMPLTYANKPLGTVGPAEWQEIEVIVDSGACETVMPRNLCQLIPMVPSAQSLAKVEYMVASGQDIPNLQYEPDDDIGGRKRST